MKPSTSYTLDKSVLDYVAETQGEKSKSQRVNELLSFAIEQEQLAALEQQAEKFFSDPRNDDRKNTRAWQKAAIRVQARDK
jgi:hypothetical protein